MPHKSSFYLGDDTGFLNFEYDGKVYSEFFNCHSHVGAILESLLLKVSEEEGAEGGESDAWRKIAYLLDHGLESQMLKMVKQYAGDIPVKVIDSKLTVDGIPVKTSFLKYVLSMGSVLPLIKMNRRLLDNPIEDNRFRTMEFVYSLGLPVTDDGYILAYKSVREDYYDYHSVSMRYAPGDEPSLEWDEVDTNTHATCSAGLHFCSRDYFRGGFFGGNGSRVMLVVVDPAEIASIPYEYGDSKGRAVRMTVLGELNVEKPSDLIIFEKDFNESINTDGIVTGVLEKWLRKQDASLITDISVSHNRGEEVDVNERKLALPRLREVIQSKDYRLRSGYGLIISEVERGEDIYTSLQEKRVLLSKMVVSQISNADDVVIVDKFTSSKAPYARAIMIDSYSVKNRVATVVVKEMPLRHYIKHDGAIDNAMSELAAV